jgi:uncharacterized repeat protein (TIGR03803 family)
MERIPTPELFLSGNKLFGTTASGGAFDQGTVFSVNRDGTGFIILHSFTTAEGYSLMGR